MALEVRIPDEIKDYKESIIAGLSIRQMICGSIALLCGIPTFLLLKNINEDVATYATMAVVAPAFCVGFIKKDGYTFEVFLKIRLNAMFAKSKRGYETDSEKNYYPDEIERYRQFSDEISAEDEQDKKDKEVKKIDRSKKGKAKTREPNEYELIEVTEKSIERKRKAAYKSLKAAARANRKKKPKEEKTA